MLQDIEEFSTSNQNGLFINSCFAHCQTERQDTWFANDAPMVKGKVCPATLHVFSSMIDTICF